MCTAQGPSWSVLDGCSVYWLQRGALGSTSIPVLFFGPSYSRASIRALLLTRAPAAALPSIPRSNADSERGKAALIARRLLDGKFGKNKVEVSLHGPCCCTMCPLLHPAVTPGQLQVGQSVSQHGLPKVLIAPAHRASCNTPPAALSPYCRPYGPASSCQDPSVRVA